MYSNRSQEEQEIIENVIYKYNHLVKEIDLINMSKLFDKNQLLYGEYEEFVITYLDISSIKLEDSN